MFKFRYIIYYFIFAIAFIFNLAYLHASNKISAEDRTYLKWCSSLSCEQICEYNEMQNNEDCLQSCFKGKREAKNHLYLEMCRKAYMQHHK